MRSILLLLALLIAVLPASAQQPIETGQWITGELTDSDTRLVDGELYDEYQFEGQAGQAYRVEVESAGFAPFIIVTGPDGYALMEKRGTAGRTSEDFAIEESGPHRVGIGGASAARGPYRLRVRRLGAVTGDLRGPNPPPPPEPEPSGPSGGARIEVLGALPQASMKSAIRGDCLQGGLTYGVIFDRLKAAVADYGEPGLFLTPTGFGLATRFERIDDDGRTIMTDRWDTAPFYNAFWQVMLHQTRPGRYRGYAIVFGTGIVDSEGPRTMGAVSDWVEAGGGRELPASIRARRGGPDHYLQLFVYEYERASTSAPARLVRPTSRHQGHLGTSLVAKIRAICGR